MKTKTKNRREFLKQSSQIGAGLLLSSCVNLPIRTVSSKEHPEFIIVGSGAGGGPLAARLARLGRKVLLIEAGQRNVDDIYKTPAFQGLASEKRNWTWDYFVKHYSDQAKKDLNIRDSKFVEREGGVLYPRASGLGGCTMHHAMITMYPDESDWLKIFDISRREGNGANGWMPADMRKIFVEKIEDNNYLSNRQMQVHRRAFGKGGWLSTEQPPISFVTDPGSVVPGGKVIPHTDAKALKKLLVASATHDGIKDDIFHLLAKGIEFDPNRISPNKRNGIYRPPQATLNGQRRGPREWLLETEKEFPENLTIIENALVTRILFDEANDPTRVIGVEYEQSVPNRPLYQASPMYAETHRDSVTRVEVLADKEVILSAGAFNTPQMLMLAGIGDHSELPAGIRRRVNLPGVGKNLQDRYEVGVVTKMKNSISQISLCQFKDDESDPCFEDYKKRPKEAIYSSNGVLLGHIMRSSQASGAEDPDLFVFAAPGYFKGYEPGWSQKALRGNDIDGEMNADHLTWAVLKSHTKNNTGYVKLKSSDPYERPEINFNYFPKGKEDPDLKAVVDGVNKARAINNSNHFKWRAEGEVWPGSDNPDLEQFILNESWGHHASCSCKMGRREEGGVVNTRFQVHGVENLRIVDASVFPEIPGMFIVLPIYMLAEKAAMEIHGQYCREEASCEKKKKA